MIRSLLPRLAGAVVTLLLAVTIAFLLARASGDPVRQMLGDMASQGQIEAVRADLGLDRPLVVQYFDYLGNIVRGDLGTSLRYHTSNWDLIASRLAASFQLAAAAIIIGVVAGVTLGTLAAMFEGKRVDRVAVSLALLGQSVPPFWLGIMLIVVVAVGLRWLPAGQAGSWSHLILPAITLSTLPMARIARMTRSSITEVLEEPYVASARARGFGTRRVMARHVARNAAIPVITLVGLQTGVLLSGAVTVEFVFAWPGLGTLTTQAVAFRDFTLIQALVVFGAVTFVLVNLVVDIVNSVVDPRIRGTL